MDTSVGIPALYMLTGRNASGTETLLWHFIDWNAVTRAVKSLQVRIAKAVFLLQNHSRATQMAIG
jgi:hypothetical protein